jgi:hypothetical protein
MTICTRCVMDTSDPDITFDAAGVCHHCHAYDEAVRTRVVPDRAARDALVGGRRHLYDAEMKEDRRTQTRPGHERTP